MPFFERLDDLCKENGIELSNLGKVIGIPVSRSSVSRWRDGVVPRNSTLKAIADYFRVDVAYLLGSETAPTRSGEMNCAECPCADDCQCVLSAQERQIIDMFRNASEIGKMRIIHSIVEIWEQDQN